jgi:hypothetical protein
MPPTHHISARARRLGAAFTAAALSAAVLMALGPLASGGQAGAAQRPARGRSVDGRSAAGPSAKAARTFSLNETGRLHLTSKHGFTLNEQGSASGTVKGTIYVHLTIVSSSHVTAQVNIYPSGGSITGNGSAKYHRGSASASFDGSMSINGGSGSYNHARGSGLSFSGTIQRSNDAVTVHVSGTASD